MVADVTAVGGLLAVLFSLLFLAQQTRAATEQTAKANNWSEVSALDQCPNGLRGIYFIWSTGWSRAVRGLSAGPSAG